MLHKEKVERIARRLKERKSKKPVSLKKKAVSHQVPKPQDKKYSDEKIDISNLNEILSIDAEKKICIAEPGVTFFDLVKATLKQNLIPMTVPEHKAITIGGAVAGCSIESMSYKYGGFHDSCIEYEIITAKGDVLICSPEKDNLIFQMMHGTFGTLGIISKITFKLIPAKKFIRMINEKYETLEDYKSAISNHIRLNDIDFMDGIIYSEKEYVLCIGNFTDNAPYTNNYNWTKVYYISTKKRKEDYIKTIDYFFRYDNGTTIPNQKTFLGRLLLGKFCGSTTILNLANRFHKLISPKKIPVIVDLFIPFSKMNDFMDWYRNEINFFPLWMVPYKQPHLYEWIEPSFLENPDELVLDIAIYGLKKSEDKDYYRIIEEELMKIRGLKTLISNNFYSEDEFWKVWNKKNYYKIKKITDPDNIFRDLYEKICKSSMGK